MSFLLKKKEACVKMKSGDNMKKSELKIPTKNYVLASIISILTVFVLCYFVFWYKSNQEYYQNNSIMSGYLSEIKENGVIENLNNYLLDNPDSFLYVSFGNDSSVKDFEIEFKNLIDKNNISSNFIYVDLNAIEDKNFIEKIQNNFFSEELKNKNIKLLKQSNIFVIENGKIIDVLYNSKQTINLRDVKQILIKYEVINYD